MALLKQFGPQDEEILKQMQMRQQPAPTMQAQPSYVAPQQQGFFQKLGAGIQDFTSDPERMARLTMALNSMRMQPDSGIAAMAQSRLENAQQQKLLKSQANATAEFLKKQGRNDLAALITQNPSMAVDILKSAIDQRGVVVGKNIVNPMTGDVIYSESDKDLAGLSGEDRTAIANVRKEFTGLPAVKDFAQQSAAYGRIVASADEPSAAGDLALIFNYMKVLDPGSVVREGEFATAQNAAGVPQRVQALYNNVLRGERLTPEQRKDFVGRAGKLYNSAEEYYKQFEDFYQSEASSIYDKATLPSFRYTGQRPSLATDIPKPAIVTQEQWDKMTDQQKRDFVGAK